MVDKFLQFKNDLEAQKGGISLFVMAKMDNIVDKWTIILAAPWITQETRNEIFHILWLFLKDKLSTEEKNQIDKIGIFNNDEPFARKFDFALRQLSQNRDSYAEVVVPYREVNFGVNGNFINEAIVLKWQQNSPLDI